MPGWSRLVWETWIMGGLPPSVVVRSAGHREMGRRERDLHFVRHNPFISNKVTTQSRPKVQ